MSELPYSDPEFEREWQAWIEYRKKIRKPYKSQDSQDRQLKWFIKMGYNVQWAIAAIDQSIRNSYQGIWPPKELVYGQKTNQWGNRPPDNNNGTSGNRIEGLKSW